MIVDIYSPLYEEVIFSMNHTHLLSLSSSLVHTRGFPIELVLINSLFVIATQLQKIALSNYGLSIAKLNINKYNGSRYLVI
jgi:hypothetical protein